MGEGMTPLLRARTGVHLKLDFLSPTLSFKDRGAVVLIAKAVEMAVSSLVADSSGNAGTAIAAYAARVGIAAEVFVPQSTSPKKVSQLRAYGANVHQIPGAREASASAAIERVEESGEFYASHVYNPFFHHGTKTFVYELWEQMGGELPSAIVIPVGNGTLLLGVVLGCSELMELGLIDKKPQLIAVQAERCAPLAFAWDDEIRQGPGVFRAIPTVAEGIAIAAPPRATQMIGAVEESGGRFVTVSDEEVISARRALLEEGIDVEPTAAAAYGGYLKWSKGRTKSERVVVGLSGAGLKSPLEAL